MAKELLKIINQIPTPFLFIEEKVLKRNISRIHDYADSHGFDTVVGHFGESSNIAAHCKSCRACIDACPTGALEDKKESDLKRSQIYV